MQLKLYEDELRDDYKFLLESDKRVCPSTLLKMDIDKSRYHMAKYCLAHDCDDCRKNWRKDLLLIKIKVGNLGGFNNER